MTESSTLVEKLKTLGLTENECKAYFALLKLGAGAAAQLSREAHLQRTQIYSLMSGLVSKGLVEETIDRPKRYKPVNVRQALPRLAMSIRDRLDKIAKESERLAAKLEGLSSNAGQTGDSPEEIRIIYGPQRARAHMLESVRSAKTEFWGMAGRRRPPHVSNHLLAEMFKLIASKGLKTRLILEVDKENYRRVAKMAAVADVSHYQPIPCYMYGADDKMVAVSLAQEPITRPSQTAQLVSTYRPTVQIMRQFFDILWRESIPYAVHKTVLLGSRAPDSWSLMTRGRKEAYIRAEAIMSAAKDSIRIYAPHRLEPIRLLKGLGETLLDAHKRGVRIRVILTLSEENANAVKKLARFMDLRNTKDTLGFSMDIVDDANAAIIHVAEDTEELENQLDYAIHVTNRQGIRHLGNLFDSLWQDSVPIEGLPQKSEEPPKSSSLPS